MGIFSDSEDLVETYRVGADSIRLCESTHTVLGNGYKCFYPANNASNIVVVHESQICNPRTYWAFRFWGIFWGLVWSSFIRWIIFGLLLEPILEPIEDTQAWFVIDWMIFVAFFFIGYYVANMSECKRNPRKYATTILNLPFTAKNIWDQNNPKHVAPAFTSLLDSLLEKTKK